MNEIKFRVMMLKAQINGMIAEVEELEKIPCQRCAFHPGIGYHPGMIEKEGTQTTESLELTKCPDCNGSGNAVGYSAPFRPQKRFD